MAKSNVSLKMDTEIKEQAIQLFNSMGMDMSTAINVLVRQCLLHKGIPFNLHGYEYTDQLQQAIYEAEHMPPDSKVYKNHAELVAEVMADTAC